VTATYAVLWVIGPNLSQGVGLSTHPHLKAAAHCAHETIGLLQRETPYFIFPNLWPPDSSDKNPVDYMVWGVMEQRVCHNRVNSVDELKECLIAVWADFQQDIIDTTIDQWRKYLHTCVHANGGHFEHLL